MTREQWERELERHLGGLSERERRRAKEYYAELYADAIESGKSEWRILSEFGSPYDAAKYVTAEHESEGFEQPNARAARREIRRRKREEKSVERERQKLRQRRYGKLRHLGKGQYAPPDFWAERGGSTKRATVYKEMEK